MKIAIKIIDALCKVAIGYLLLGCFGIITMPETLTVMLNSGLIAMITDKIKTLSDTMNGLYYQCLFVCIVALIVGSFCEIFEFDDIKTFAGVIVACTLVYMILVPWVDNYWSFLVNTFNMNKNTGTMMIITVVVSIIAAIVISCYCTFLPMFINTIFGALGGTIIGMILAIPLYFPVAYFGTRGILIILIILGIVGKLFLF